MSSLVSIIIPVFNGSNYLGDAIESALNQTYSNCEVLVINDGSNDEGLTEAVALKYKNKIRYYVKENGGCGSALNYGIREMRGDYFSWLSHDDLYLPNKIQHQIDLLGRSKGKKFPVVYCGYEVIDSNSNWLVSVNFDTNHTVNDLNLPLYPVVKNLIHGCSLLIHKSWLNKIGLFDEKLMHTQDYDYWLRLMRIAPILYDSKILIKSRVHPGQTTYSHGRNEECNKFWCNLLKSMNPQEIASISKSTFYFYASMKIQLSKTPFKDAELLALDLSKKAFSQKKCQSFLERIQLSLSSSSILTNIKAVVARKTSISWIVMKLREDGLLQTAKRIFKF